MKFARPTKLTGCFELVPPVHSDDRGSLIKPFHASTFEGFGLGMHWRELFYTESARGVVRALHFQEPPADQHKLVCCVVGEIFDVVVDLRAGSPTFGLFDTLLLRGVTKTAVFVPSGLAHGYAALTDAVVAYAVTSEYDAICDSGLRWDSVPGVDWPVVSPVLSERDAALPRFEDFATPFTYRSPDA